MCYFYSSASLGWLVYGKNRWGTLSLEVGLRFYNYLILFFGIWHHAGEALYNHQILIKN